jgi:hypothetical protein
MGGSEILIKLNANNETNKGLPLDTTGELILVYLGLLFGNRLG